MPQISVIVPVYKVEAYLSRCLDSILSQTFRDFELILVDDGSPDRCGQLCEGYAAGDSRIHVIHQENGGLSAARNSGIDWAFAHSDSRYLAFVDSDDYVSPEYLERLYRAAVETGCAISICGIARTRGEPLPEPAEEGPRVMDAEDYYCSETIHGGMTMVAVNKLYDRALFETLRYPKGKLHEDEFTTYRAVYQAERVAVLSEPLYGYFQNDAGIMRARWSPKRIHALEAVEEQMDFAQGENHPRLLGKAMEQYIFTADAQLEQALEDPQYRSYGKILRKKLRWGLKQGRKTGAFPWSGDHLRFYEKAYPIKPLWWLVSKVRES